MKLAESIDKTAPNCIMAYNLQRRLTSWLILQNSQLLIIKLIGLYQKVGMNLRWRMMIGLQHLKKTLTAKLQNSGSNRLIIYAARSQKRAMFFQETSITDSQQS